MRACGRYINLILTDPNKIKPKKSPAIPKNIMPKKILKNKNKEKNEVIT